MLDSLVRVSRRVKWNHLVIISVPGTHLITTPYNQGHKVQECRETMKKMLCPNTQSQFTNEFTQALSFARERGTMSLSFSTIVNWRWHTRREAPTTFGSKRNATFALMHPDITSTINNLTKIHWFHSLTFQQFQALLTLFPKSFSPFPHGTCLLSVSNQYLAWDEIYHPLCTPFPRSVTLRIYAVHGGLQMKNRTITLTDALFQETYTCASVGNTSRDYNSRPEAPISMLSCSLFVRHYWRNPI